MFLQAFLMVRFLWHYAIPVVVFVYCYGRIFHVIRRQGKVVGSHAGNAPTATTSLDQQVQQQATGVAASGAKLSRTELNVLQTMIAVIVCFLVFWSVSVISNLSASLGVSNLVAY